MTKTCCILRCIVWHCNLWPQSSEQLKELYTKLMEKLEAHKKSSPVLEEKPSLDLGLHTVTVPTTTSSAPTTPFWSLVNVNVYRGVKL